ncbi:RNA methyltransferase [Candidatus Poribacteria bacterium]|nr:RNA methyltransferase [Candidatus Poribacteria bacterium]MYB64148.1 RNA methyltransferase [Candidatus Poribacteria bacterium]
MSSKSYEKPIQSTKSFRAIPVTVPENLANIRIILFEPREPGNIGSVARVVKGMGLSELYLVNPVPFQNVDAAYNMAHGARDLLKNCNVVPELKDALEGIQYLVGTTHRRRDVRLPPPVTARDAAQKIASISQDKSVALLFGREDFGLSTDQISLCQLTASVPMATKNPSLNLAQAVQIFVYEVFIASLEDNPLDEIEYAELNALEDFYGRVTRLLDKVGMSPYNQEWETYLKSLRRVFSRAPLEERDIATLDMIFSTAYRYIIRLEEKLGMKQEE